MGINLGSRNFPKYLKVTFVKDNSEMKMIELFKHKFGWDFNIWKFMITFDKF